MLATAGYGQPVALWRLLALATLLYLAHTPVRAGRAAALRRGGGPGRAHRAGCSGRGAVVLAAAVLGVLLLGSAPVERGGGTCSAATIGGLAVAVGIAGLLAWLLRRG